jgi:hypothetical protein
MSKAGVKPALGRSSQATERDMMRSASSSDGRPDAGNVQLGKSPESHDLSVSALSPLSPSPSGNVQLAESHDLSLSLSAPSLSLSLLPLSHVASIRNWLGCWLQLNWQLHKNRARERK